MNESRLRIGLIGCGQIADAHLQQIRRIERAELVAVSDREPLLARQAAERYSVPQRFSSSATMLREARPDVVHITTPVRSHAPLAIELLDAGVHVYVEKPFTVDATEARAVVAAAERNQRHVCVGHDQLFDPAWLRVRELVASGIPGEIRHVESVLGYPIDGPFGRLVVSTPDHWVRDLPGGLFQNTISHPLYRITEFIDDDDPTIEATWFRGDSGVPFPTEMRASLFGNRVSGSLLFTSTVRPYQRVTRLYGSKAGLEVDLDTQLVRVHRSNRYPGVFARVEAPFRLFRESCGNLKGSLSRFVRGEFHYFEGMKRLFEEFYAAVQNGSAPPISNSEAVRVTGIMDRIFEACRDSSDQDEKSTDMETVIDRPMSAATYSRETLRDSPITLVAHGQD